MELDLSVEEPGEEPSESLAERLGHQARQHPIALLMIVIVALVGAGAVAAVRLRPPQPAPVTLYDLGHTALSVNGVAWEPRADGRPERPPVLEVVMVVQRAGSGAGADVETRVVGIAGPGIVRSDNPAVVVPPAGPVEVPLRVVLDCARLPETTAPGAYTLRSEARSADSGAAGVGEIGTGTIDLGTSSARWATLIRQTCSAWLGRQHLTITALTATADPIRPRVALELSVVNTGDRPATLDRYDVQGIRIEGRLPITVPAHGRSDVALTAVLDRCDSVNTADEDPDSQSLPPSLSQDIGLSGLSGARPSDAGPSQTETGFGAFGEAAVLIAPDAHRTLRTGLRTACAGLGPVLSLVVPGAVRYDAASRQLTVPLRLLTSPGRVRALSLTPQTEPSPDGQPGFRPRWTALTDLAPDSGGEVRVVLRYRASTGYPSTDGTCPLGVSNPPGATATLDVPVPGGERRLTYTVPVNLGEDPTALELLC